MAWRFILINSLNDVMPQTKFVLSNSFKTRFKIVIINKLDKPDQKNKMKF